jgi:DNA modification methylase
MMNIDLILGDCLEKMRMIPDGSVDLILTDLPYSSKKKRVTDLDWDSEIDLGLLWSEYKRVIKRNGVVALNAGMPFLSRIYQSNPDWYKYEYIWIKSQAANFQLAKVMPLKKHEYVAVFYKSRPTYNPQMTKGENKKKRIGNAKYQDRKNPTYMNTKMVNLEAVDSDTYYPTTILSIPSVPRNKSLHKTQKPVELAEFFIRTYSNKGDIVLDSAAGVFTTGIACLNTGRNFVGIEKERDIFEIGRQRVIEHKAANELTCEIRQWEYQ